MILYMVFLDIDAMRSETLGYFRFKKFDEKTYIITNDIWEHSFLEVNDFSLFISGKLKEGEKYEELKRKWFIKWKNDDIAKENEMAYKYANKNHFVGTGPSLHIIVTTLRCNHSCRYCHASVSTEESKQFDMSRETAKRTVDTIFYTSAPSFTIEFQGWESLLNWDIIKYITEYAEVKAMHLQKNVSFALVSNLTAIDDEKLDYLTKHNISISTSLDGDEYIHNHNRTYTKGNSFKEVTHWIKKINASYAMQWHNAKVGALLTTTKQTLPRYKECIDTYVELGLDGIFLRQLNPYGFAAKIIDQIGYSVDEFLEFYINSMEYILELNKKGITFKENFACIFLWKILTPRDPNYLDERSPCGACIWQVAYNYDGKVYSCDEGRMFGRVGDESFLLEELSDDPETTYQNMMESDVTRIMVQASTLDGLPGYNDHVYKPYIWVCPIHSYKASNNVFPNFSKDQRVQLDIKVIDYLFEKLRDPENVKVFQKWLGMSDELIRLQC